MSQEKMIELARKYKPVDQELPYDLQQQGYVGLRDTLTSQYGIEDKDIGWNEATGKPTVFGNDIPTDALVRGTNGRFWIKPEDIEGIVMKHAPQIMGKTALREYVVGEYGINNTDLKYVGGRVTLNGVPLEITSGYIGADGNFYADQSEIDRIMEEKGYTSDKLSAQRTDEIYNILQTAMQDLNKPYDLATDPMYRQAVDEATRAIREDFTKRGIAISSDMESRIYQTALKLAPQFEQLALEKKMNLLKGTLSIVQEMGTLDDRMLNFAQYELQIQKFRADQEIAEQARVLESERNAIQDAWDRVSVLGYVDNATSTVLGLPVGTPSIEARERAEQLIDFQIEQDLVFQDLIRRSDLEFENNKRWLDYQAQTYGGTSGGGTGGSYTGGGTSGTTATAGTSDSSVAAMKYNSYKTQIQAGLSNKTLSTQAAAGQIAASDLTNDQKKRMIEELGLVPTEGTTTTVGDEYGKVFQPNVYTIGGRVVSKAEYDAYYASGQSNPSIGSKIVDWLSQGKVTDDKGGGGGAF
jgi:hypothetical protein